jgi:superoxide dismutase
MKDLKPFYKAANQQEGYFHLLALEEKWPALRWAKKYPVAVQSWFNNCEYLKYKNKRADFVDSLFNIINWDNAVQRLENALKLTK